MNAQAIRVVLVATDAKLADLVRTSLPDGVTVVTCNEGNPQTVLSNSPNALIVDVSLASTEFVELLLSQPRVPPVIALVTTDASGLEALRAGLQEYVCKDSLGTASVARALQSALARPTESERITQLRWNNERCQALLRSTTDYIYTVEVSDGQPTRTEHGPGCVALTGYSAGEYRTDSFLWYRMVHEEDRRGVIEQATRALKGEIVPPLEHRILHKSAGIRWVKSTLVARKDEHGRVIAYDGLISDVTDRKRAEGRLSTEHAVAKVIAQAAGLDEATPKIVRAVCEHLDWDLGAVWQIHPTLQVLRSIAFWRRSSVRAPQLEAATMSLVFAPGVGLPGRIWASGTPEWVPELSQAAEGPRSQLALREGLRCAFGVPISLGDRTLGVMEFFSRESQQLDEDLLATVATVGSQLGQFIERKRNEHALAEERNLLRILIDSLPDPIYVKDTESRFLIGNLAVARIMGAVDPDRLTGKRDSDFYPRELADRYYADEREVIDKGKALINYEEPVVDPQGITHRVLSTKVPLLDRSGQLVGLVGVGRDITELKRLEAERDRFFTLSLDMLCIVGYDGCFKQLNPAWEKTLGYSKAELLGRPLLELVHPDDRAISIASAKRSAQGHEIGTLENRYLCKDGSYRWLLWSSCPFPEQQLIYAAARDITHRKESEAKLRQANAELTRSEDALRRALADVKQSHQELKATQLQLIQTAKLESVGTLAAGVAHEVKNPLQIVLMGVDYLSRNLRSIDHNVPDVLQDMRDAIARADNIVRGLLEFAAANRPEARDEDLNHVITSSLEFVKFELVKAHVEVRETLARNLPTLKLDKTKIQQVFINLFMNAIHSMARGGALTVSTYLRCLSDVESDAGQQNVARLRVGDTVSFKVGAAAVVATIEDTGTGIPEEALPNIFDPFFTTKPPGQGSGLGLTVVKKIMDLHGGSIDVRNRPEGGVIVTLVFKTWRTT